MLVAKNNQSKFIHSLPISRGQTDQNDCTRDIKEEETPEKIRVLIILR